MENLGETTMSKHKYFLGIDVSKSKLDMSLYDGKNHKVFKTKCNDYNTANIIIDHYQINPKNTKVIMECTGVYHTIVAATFHELGYQVVTHNPAEIKAYREATGKVTKTDKADAKLIADYGYLFDPKPKTPRSPLQSALVECIQILKQTTKAQTQCKNRKEAISHLNSTTEFLIAENENDLIYYKEKIERIWVHIKAIIKKHYKDLYKLYTSIPGVGPHIAVTIIAYFGKFENFDNAKKVQSFVGVCPSIKQSGSSIKGSNRITRRGNSNIRNLLYMGALSAMTYNNFAKVQFDRLVATGKAKRLSLVAVINKLIRQLFAIAKSGKKWDKDHLQKRQELQNIRPEMLKIA